MLGSPQQPTLRPGIPLPTTGIQTTPRRGNTRRWAALLSGIVVATIGLGWLGLQIKPAPFPPFPQQQPPLESIPLPSALPAPVERYYRQIYGDSIPVIESAVITGRAEMRPFGITLPTRFRFTHIAGQGYRHYIEATLFGHPFLKIDERYLDGKGLMEFPFGITESGPQIDQGANLGLWAESSWFPALYLTDPRVRWEPVDDVTALLVVPFGESEERYVVRFDPDSGLPTLFESMRYKGSSDKHKTLWLNQPLEWGMIDGVNTSTVGSALWLDDGRPWAVFTLEEMVFNVEVDDYIRAKGP